MHSKIKNIKEYYQHKLIQTNRKNNQLINNKKNLNLGQMLIFKMFIIKMIIFKMLKYNYNNQNHKLNTFNKIIEF